MRPSSLALSLFLQGHQLWGGPAMHGDSFVTRDGNFSKSTGLMLSFHVCPFFCSFNETIIENAGHPIFVFKALVRSAVQALAGPAVLARPYWIPSPCASLLLSHTDKTRGHTRPPYQEKLLICWPDFARMGCMCSVLVLRRGRTQPEFCVSLGSLQQWPPSSSSPPPWLSNGGKESLRLLWLCLINWKWWKSAHGFLAFKAELASTPLEITCVIIGVLEQVFSLCILSPFRLWFNIPSLPLFWLLCVLVLRDFLPVYWKLLMKNFSNTLSYQ